MKFFEKIFNKEDPNQKESKILNLSTEALEQSEKIQIKSEDRNEKGELLVYPNGPVSNLSERDWKIVRTRAFKNWFGDWQTHAGNSSKVVNPETKEPLLVFHSSKVKEFKGLILQPEMSSQKLGTFFTSNIDLAKSFAKGEDSAVFFSSFLRIKNPLLVHDHNHLVDFYFNGTDKNIISNKGYDGIMQKYGLHSKDSELSGDQYVAFESDSIMTLPSEINK